MTPAAPRRWALVASVLVGVLGPQWWLVPETSPFGPDAAAAVAGAVLLGTTGTATALALGHRLGPAARRLTAVAAGGQVLVLGWVALAIAADLIGSDGPGGVGMRLLYVGGSLSVGALWLSIAARVPRLTPVVATEGTPACPRRLIGWPAPSTCSTCSHTTACWSSAAAMASR